VCIRAGTIPAFAVAWVGLVYDLLAFGLLITDVRSKHLSHWIGQAISSILSNGFHVLE
jgi:hypothetical protein